MRIASKILLAATVAAAAIPAAGASTPRDEMIARADASFATYRTKCGDIVLFAIDVEAPGSGGAFAPRLDQPALKPTRYTIYVQMAEVRFVRQESRLSDADRRNGVQWRGRVAYNAASIRQISVGADGTRGAWTPWTQASQVFAANLTLGPTGWEVRVEELSGLSAYGRFATLRKPRCEETPAG